MRLDHEDPSIAGSPDWWAARQALNTDAPVQPGRPALDVQRTIEVALQFVDEAGPEMLSMRRLAERLHSGTATLYRHFRSREEILVLVVDWMLAKMPEEANSSTGPDWRVACARQSTALYHLLQHHPRVVPLLVAQVPVGPNARRLRERALQVFLDGGFPPALAARAYSAIMNYVLGAAHRISDGGPLLQAQQLRAFYRGMASTDFSATNAVAEVLPMVSEEEEFMFGLELLLEGLAVIRGQGTSLTNEAFGRRLSRRRA
jgi:AcrR family transcriptional regulator